MEIGRAHRLRALRKNSQLRSAQPRVLAGRDVRYTLRARASAWPCRFQSLFSYTYPGGGGGGGAAPPPGFQGSGEKYHRRSGRRLGYSRWLPNAELWDTWHARWPSFGRNKKVPTIVAKQHMGHQTLRLIRHMVSASRQCCSGASKSAPFDHMTCAMCNASTI